jgi:phosphatidylethanolamine/phosphatidyl-N-methylethanolamine N-methyltransferase
MSNKFDYEKNIMGVSTDIVQLSDKNLVASRLNRFLEGIKKKTGLFLEIGCGGGHFVQSVKKYRADLKVTGLDISQHAILAAKKVNMYHKLSIQYVIADGISLPFKKETVDIIALMDVIEHISNIELLLEECYRVLKNNGVIHASFPCEGQPFTSAWLFNKIRIGKNLSQKHLGHIQQLSHRQFFNLLEKHRFKIEKCTYSRHLVAQCILFISFYLPKEILVHAFGEKISEQCKDAAEWYEKKGDNDSITISILRFTKNVWKKIANLLDTISYYEGELCKKYPVTAQNIHLTGTKRR